MLNISIDGYADRVQEPCGKCHGEGHFYKPVMPDLGEVAGPEITHETEMVEARKILMHCHVCQGVGWVLPKDGHRVEVYQSDELIGSCTVPATLVPHIFVDQRPGDFVPKLRNGKMVYQMSNTLCPGDWELLKGFQRNIKGDWQ